MINLFSKEKDLILRIMNLVLIIWLLTAIILTISATYNLIDHESKMRYPEFKASGCSEYYYDKTDSEITEEECKANYVRYERDYRQSQRGRRTYLIISLTQVILVSGTLYFTNKNQK